MFGKQKPGSGKRGQPATPGKAVVAPSGKVKNKVAGPSPRGDQIEAEDNAYAIHRRKKH